MLNACKIFALKCALPPCRAGLHNSESSKGEIIDINLQQAAKSPFYFDVEISLWYGGECRTTITDSMTSFCSILHNCETASSACVVRDADVQCFCLKEIVRWGTKANR